MGSLWGVVALHPHSEKRALTPFFMRSYFLTLQVMFFGLVMGPAMLGGVAWLLIQTGSVIPVAEGMLDVVFGTAVPSVGIGAFYASKWLFGKRMPDVIARPTLEEKLEAYRTELILKYTLLETPAILAFLAYVLTGTILFFGIGTAMLLFLIVVRPTRDGAVMDLQLNESEAAAVRGDAVRKTL